jgi:hypothetical protein
MLIKRIYFYRKSALEIFTETKSYYFNFKTKEELNDLISIVNSHCEDFFFPININNENLGYIKLKESIIKENRLNHLKTNFYDFFFSDNLGEMCIFDIIMLINLISNRSYIDIFQYPIFPLLFFCNTENIVFKRDFSNHIGLQTVDESSREREQMIVYTYEQASIEDMECSYFNTHYSNDIYTSNFMIRLFPYSFCALDLQGDYFDNPNRLFFSIRETFNNILVQKADLRELIPEFYYLPEMFINFNKIKYGERQNKDEVDDVIMPNNILFTNIGNLPEDINNENINEIIKDDDKNTKHLRYFIFVDCMKKKLENMEMNDLLSWLNLIFGDEQKYKKSKRKQKELYFRKESFIDINSTAYERYINDNIIMDSVDFGLLPLQTISNIEKKNYFKDRKNFYEIIDDSIESTEINNFVLKQILDNNRRIQENTNMKLKDNKNNKIYEYEKYNLNLFKYWDEDLNYDFKIENDDNFGKLNIYKDGKLINEIIDHSDKINYVFYNRRLNMFATTSFDGFACIYILPGKLISSIKHPDNLYFDEIFLSSNPFSTIITYEKTNNTLYSYSLSGILIKTKKFYDPNIRIVPVFNIYGGSFRDRIKVLDNTYNIINVLNIPFFDEYRATKK